MIRMSRFRLLLLGLYWAILNISCEKNLNAKSDLKHGIPSSLEELQQLLDNYQKINQKSPRAADMSTDEYFLTDSDWAALNGNEKGIYCWNKGDLFTKVDEIDWANAYAIINIANTVLTYIEWIKGPEEVWKNVKGQALFHRANMFLQIAFIWAPAYDEKTAGTDLGIPLKLDPDPNKPIQRASVKQTYEQIISDLKIAAELLPSASLHNIRPSKPAAHALLARTYLAMRQYDSMGVYVAQSLRYINAIKDFNTLDKKSSIQFSFAPELSFEEIIFGSNIANTAALKFTMAKVDPELYKLFDENDLRKRILFTYNNNGTIGFIGNYSGTINLFSGIAVNETWLMQAEYFARMGATDSAMKYLNKLLEKRFALNTFKPLKANTPKQALEHILKERRKELILRGLRWMDIKRLNKEGASIKLKRTVNGRVYELHPNDPRYALPIPEAVIETSGMQQNPE